VRSRRFDIRFAIAAIAAAVAAGIAAHRTTIAFASDPAGDVLDQESAVVTHARARCLVRDAGLAQSFRPTATPLAAVALDIRAVPPPGDSVRVRLRTGATRGRVLGKSQAFVTADGWVRFAFDPPIGVEMGSDYVIEWIGTGAWWACSEANPYRRGFAFNCDGGILPARDFNFRTYAPAQHWEQLGWSAWKMRMAPGGSGVQERGSTKSRVEGGRAR
jgi:hypothetical protein